MLLAFDTITLAVSESCNQLCSKGRGVSRSAHVQCEHLHISLFDRILQQHWDHAASITLQSMVSSFLNLHAVQLQDHKGQCHSSGPVYMSNQQNPSRMSDSQVICSHTAVGTCTAGRRLSRM